MKKMEKIQKGDLYSLLSVCSNEELAPLVKCITETFTNHLDTYEVYKNNTPNHIKYYKEIADEIRLFGSDSFATIFRDGNGVLYDEIVKDVCVKLDTPCENDIIKNENNLIILTKLNASSHNSFIDVMKYVAPMFLRRSNPLASLLIIKELSSEAYRVTIPCVLYIALLRKKKIQDYLSWVQKKRNENTISHKCNETISVVNNNNDSILTISQMSDQSHLSTWEPIKENKDISRLNALLQLVPNAVTARHVKATKYMEVVIKGDLIKATDGNGYRAIAKNTAGKFDGTARLLDPKKLSKLVNFAAIYNIASMLVAQQHLAEINAKLVEIKEDLETIKQFQINERESKIKGAILYFEQVASSIMQGDYSDSILNQIEAKESELLSIQSHLLKDIDITNKKKELNDKETFGTKEMTKSIEDYQNCIFNLYSQLFLCIRARSCGWQLLSMYPTVSKDLIRSRNISIRSVIESLKEKSSLNESNESIEYNIRKLSAICNSAATLNKRKLSLKNQLDDQLMCFNESLCKTDNELLTAENLYKNRESGKTKLFLEIKGESIVKVSSGMFL